MTSSNKWHDTVMQKSNTLMVQTLHSIKNLISESVTEHDIPTELENDDSYIPVRIQLRLGYSNIYRGRKN